MAIAPKVKFKTVAADQQVGIHSVDYDNPESEQFYQSFKTFSEEIKPQEQSPEHLNTYLILLYVTQAQEDKKENYTTYLVEFRNGLVHYFNRYDVVKKYADTSLANGTYTGFVLHGFKISSLYSNGMLSMNKYKKFQVKKKTFLNGPLKDNEFLAKKGKHFA